MELKKSLLPHTIGTKGFVVPPKFADKKIGLCGAIKDACLTARKAENARAFAGFHPPGSLKKEL